MPLLPFTFSSPGAFGLTLVEDGDGRFCFVSSLDDDPSGGKGTAEKLGIKIGDVLVHINETDVQGLPFATVINIIKGTGFPVRFTMMRAGQATRTEEPAPGTKRPRPEPDMNAQPVRQQIRQAPPPQRQLAAPSFNPSPFFPQVPQEIDTWRRVVEYRLRGNGTRLTPLSNEGRQLSLQRTHDDALTEIGARFVKEILAGAAGANGSGHVDAEEASTGISAAAAKELVEEMKSRMAELKTEYSNIMNRKTNLKKNYDRTRTHHQKLDELFQAEHGLLDGKLQNLNKRIAGSSIALKKHEQSFIDANKKHEQSLLDAQRNQGSGPSPQETAADIQNLANNRKNTQAQLEAARREEAKVKAILKKQSVQGQCYKNRCSKRVDLMKSICEKYDLVLQRIHHRMVNLNEMIKRAERCV